MGLVKKGKKKKLRSTGRGAGSISAKRPQQTERRAPCMVGCYSGNNVRGWITTIAQRGKSGLDEDTAFAKAWEIIVETNPFPATMGRVCPHHCETSCTRSDKDGGVSINAMERYLGDWAIEHGLELPKPDAEAQPESIGVIGAGPSGLTFAYMMSRRGYQVTIYEEQEAAGGMLRYGIPWYRLPAEVLDSEIARVVDAGVDLKLGTKVGRDVSVDELRGKHKVLFLGIGAWTGRKLRIEGEDGPGVFTGTDYLSRIHKGETIDVGKKVIVIGGGDTAIDAARVARRNGAEVEIVYRRTRTEMPAIDGEVEEAFKEDVGITFLAAPVAVSRDPEGRVKALVVQKMELGEPDSSGRRRPVPIEGSEYTIATDTVIAAISQAPDWVEELKPETRWLEPDETGRVEPDVWAGGDVIDLGVAATAIRHGRRAAEAIHAELRGLEPPADSMPDLPREKVRLDLYDGATAIGPAHRPVEEWLDKPDDEISLGITKEQFLAEADRCLSCGLCYGCERCWMFCTPSCFKKLDDPGPGHYYKVDLDTCDGCSKCADECPCGYLVMV